jgi:hypothetical protein
MRTPWLALAVMIGLTSAARAGGPNDPRVLDVGPRAVACDALAAGEPEAARPLRVLYVGNASTGRGRSYARFLAERFKLVGAVERDSFDPSSAAAADAVVLDWSQSDVRFERAAGSSPEAHLKSPLGERSRWDRPTVLLGSAGHLLAAPWKVFGGSG